jgi:hypothetical protein
MSIPKEGEVALGVIAEKVCTLSPVVSTKSCSGLLRGRPHIPITPGKGPVGFEMEKSAHNDGVALDACKIQRRSMMRIPLVDAIVTRGDRRSNEVGKNVGARFPLDWMIWNSPASPMEGSQVQMILCKRIGSSM